MSTLSGPRIAGLVLAAGLSRRLGQPKQLLRLGGRTLVNWPLAALRDVGVDPLVLVIGHREEEVMRAIDVRDVRVVVNPRFVEGLSTSLKFGILSIATLCPEVQGALVLAGDQPLVGPELLRALIDEFDRGTHPIVATAHADHTGVPMLLGRDSWPLLDLIGEDQGARALLRARSDLVSTVAASDERMALDVDTMADYQRLLALVERGHSHG